MIHFNPETCVFNLLLRGSYYPLQIDAPGRLLHLGWGPRPDGATDGDRLSREAVCRMDETSAGPSSTAPAATN
jgi:hypothetical protein